MTKIPLSPRKGNIKSCHYHTVVKGCLIDDLEVVVSPEVACGFKNDSNYCDQFLSKFAPFVPMWPEFGHMKQKNIFNSFVKNSYGKGDHILGFS